jgi:hypothetical protein
VQADPQLKVRALALLGNIDLNPNTAAESDWKAVLDVATAAGDKKGQNRELGLVAGVNGNLGAACGSRKIPTSGSRKIRTQENERLPRPFLTFLAAALIRSSAVPWPVIWRRVNLSGRPHRRHQEKCLSAFARSEIQIDENHSLFNATCQRSSSVKVVARLISARALGVLLIWILVRPNLALLAIVPGDDVPRVLDIVLAPH